MRLIDADELRANIERDRSLSDMPKMWHNGIAYAVNHIIHAPTVEIPMSEDLISRQAAIEAIRKAVTKECAEWSVKDLPSAQPDLDKKELIRTITAGIIATNTKNVYSCGMRNGMRWCKALLEEDPPKFEDASLYAQPERKKGKLLPTGDAGTYNGDVVEVKCSECGCTDYFEPYVLNGFRLCPWCGAEMTEGEDDVD